MTLSEGDGKYIKALKWAQLPENRKSLPTELQALVDIVEGKLAAMRPKSSVIYTSVQSVKWPENKEIALTLSPLGYYIHR